MQWEEQGRNCGPRAHLDGESVGDDVREAEERRRGGEDDLLGGDPCHGSPRHLVQDGNKEGVHRAALLEALELGRERRDRDLVVHCKPEELDEPVPHHIPVRLVEVVQPLPTHPRQVAVMASAKAELTVRVHLREQREEPLVACGEVPQPIVAPDDLGNPLLHELALLPRHPPVQGSPASPPPHLHDVHDVVAAA